VYCEHQEYHILPAASISFTQVAWKITNKGSQKYFTIIKQR